MLTVIEFAKMVKVSTRTVRRWMAVGMPYVMVGRIIRIDEVTAYAWMQKQRGEKGVIH